MCSYHYKRVKKKSESEILIIIKIITSDEGEFLFYTSTCYVLFEKFDLVIIIQYTLSWKRNLGVRVTKTALNHPNKQQYKNRRTVESRRLLTEAAANYRNCFSGAKCKLANVGNELQYVNQYKRALVQD